jgi:hypothetical protein
MLLYPIIITGLFSFVPALALDREVRLSTRQRQAFTAIPDWLRRAVVRSEAHDNGREFTDLLESSLELRFRSSSRPRDRCRCRSPGSRWRR